MHPHHHHPSSSSSSQAANVTPTSKPWQGEISEAERVLFQENMFNLLRSISKDVPTEQLITATRNWERSRFYQCNSKDEYLITINEKISELKLRWQLHQQQRARSAGPPAPSAAVPTSIPSTSSKSFLSNTPYSTSTSTAAIAALGNANRNMMGFNAMNAINNATSLKSQTSLNAAAAAAMVDALKTSNSNTSNSTAAGILAAAAAAAASGGTGGGGGNRILHASSYLQSSATNKPNNAATTLMNNPSGSNIQSPAIGGTGANNAAAAAAASVLMQAAAAAAANVGPQAGKVNGMMPQQTAMKTTSSTAASSVELAAKFMEAAKLATEKLRLFLKNLTRLDWPAIPVTPEKMAKLAGIQTVIQVRVSQIEMKAINEIELQDLVENMKKVHIEGVIDPSVLTCLVIPGLEAELKDLVYLQLLARQQQRALSEGKTRMSVAECQELLKKAGNYMRRIQEMAMKYYESLQRMRYSATTTTTMMPPPAPMPLVSSIAPTAAISIKRISPFSQQRSDVGVKKNKTDDDSLQLLSSVIRSLNPSEIPIIYKCTLGKIADERFCEFGSDPMGQDEIEYDVGPPIYYPW